MDPDLVSPRPLTPAAIEFVTERHLATLTTLRADGSPHVVPVGFTFDPAAGSVRVITFSGAVKAANAAAGRRAAVCQVDGARWITLEGVPRVTDDPAAVGRAVEAYAERYRPPKERTDRVVIEIAIDRVSCSSRLSAAPPTGAAAPTAAG